MLSPADRIVEATMPHTLRPKRGNREKVIAATLEFLIEEFGYDTEFGMIGTIRNDVIDVEDIRNLIDELKSTVTLEEPAQGHSKTDLDAL
jgi:hypothetical protein